MLQIFNHRPLFDFRRFVANETLFGEILGQAKKAIDGRLHIGGNAPLMASRFAKEGAQVTSIDVSITLLNG